VIAETFKLTFCSLKRWDHPPKDLASQSARKLEKLVAAANLQKGKFYPIIPMFTD
jgi:hypothetical protein